MICRLFTGDRRQSNENMDHRSEIGGQKAQCGHRTASVPSRGHFAVDCPRQALGILSACCRYCGVSV